MSSILIIEVKRTSFNRGAHRRPYYVHIIALLCYRAFLKQPLGLPCVLHTTIRAYYSRQTSQYIVPRSYCVIAQQTVRPTRGLSNGPMIEAGDLNSPVGLLNILCKHFLHTMYTLSGHTSQRLHASSRRIVPAS